MNDLASKLRQFIFTPYCNMSECGDKIAASIFFTLLGICCALIPLVSDVFHQTYFQSGLIVTSLVLFVNIILNVCFEEIQFKFKNYLVNISLYLLLASLVLLMITLSLSLCYYAALHLVSYLSFIGELNQPPTGMA